SAQRKPRPWVVRAQPNSLARGRQHLRVELRTRHEKVEGLVGLGPVRCDSDGLAKRISGLGELSAARENRPSHLVSPCELRCELERNLDLLESFREPLQLLETARQVPVR